MAYATIEQFIENFGQWEAVEVSNLDDASDQLVDADRLQTALENASGEIDSYLAQAGYTLPLATVPAFLVQRCCDIARYRLENRNTRQEVIDRYKDAIAWLRDVAKGVATIGPIENDTSVTQLTSVLTGKINAGSTFNSSSLQGY